MYFATSNSRSLFILSSFFPIPYLANLGDRVSVRGLISGPFSLPASWVPNSRLALHLVYQASGFQLRSSFCWPRSGKLVFWFTLVSRLCLVQEEIWVGVMIWSLGAAVFMVNAPNNKGKLALLTGFIVSALPSSIWLYMSVALSCYSLFSTWFWLILLAQALLCISFVIPSLSQPWFQVLPGSSSLMGQQLLRAIGSA